MKNNVKIQRVMLGYTQQELADLIQVSRQTIHAIESGKYIPSTVLSLKLAKCFNSPLEEIFELEDGD